MASHDAGVQVTCRGCGQVVLQKAMIPVLGEDGQGMRYLCQVCARALIVPPSVPGDEQPPAEDEPTGAEPAEGDPTGAEPAMEPAGAEPAVEPAG